MATVKDKARTRKISVHESTVFVVIRLDDGCVDIFSQVVRLPSVVEEFLVCEQRVMDHHVRPSCPKRRDH